MPFLLAAPLKKPRNWFDLFNNFAMRPLSYCAFNITEHVRYQNSKPIGGVNVNVRTQTGGSLQSVRLRIRGAGMGQTFRKFAFTYYVNGPFERKYKISYFISFEMK